MQKEKNILDFEFKSLYPARYQGNLFVYLLKNFINLSSEEKEFIYQSQSKLLKKRKGRLTASKLNKFKPGHNHSKKTKCKVHLT